MMRHIGCSGERLRAAVSVICLFYYHLDCADCYFNSNSLIQYDHMSAIMGALPQNIETVTVIILVDGLRIRHGRVEVLLRSERFIVNSSYIVKP